MELSGMDISPYKKYGLSVGWVTTRWCASVYIKLQNFTACQATLVPDSSWEKGFDCHSSRFTWHRFMPSVILSILEKTSHLSHRSHTVMDTLGNHTADKTQVGERLSIISPTLGTSFPVQIRLNGTKRFPDCAALKQSRMNKLSWS